MITWFTMSVDQVRKSFCIEKIAIGSLRSTWIKNLFVLYEYVIYASKRTEFSYLKILLLQLDKGYFSQLKHYAIR